MISTPGSAGSADNGFGFRVSGGLFFHHKNTEVIEEFYGSVLLSITYPNGGNLSRKMLEILFLFSKQ